MKLALVIKEFTNKRGGGEKYTVDLCRELLKLGHEVHVFANRYQVDGCEGAIFHRVPMVRAISFLKVLTFPAMVRRRLKREKFDLVYGLTQIYPQDVHFLGGGLQRVWLALKHPRPFPRRLALIRPLNLALDALEKRIFQPNNYRRIIANSQLCRQQLVEHYQVPAGKIEVVYNGVDTDRFSPQVKERFRESVRSRYQLGSEEILLLFVAHNFARKGLGTIISALRMLKETQFSYRLLVVGAGKAGPFIRQAKELDVADRLIFAGASSSIEQLYAGADILLLPTRYDPFASVCLEAMACGLPVITSKYNGAAEVIPDKELVLDDPLESRDLAKKIFQLSSASVREEQGKSSREVACQLTMAEVGRRTETILVDVLRGKRAEE